MSRRDNTSAAIGAALYGLATRATRRLPRDMSLTSAATLATLDRTGPRRITDLAAERIRRGSNVPRDRRAWLRLLARLAGD